MHGNANYTNDMLWSYFQITMNVCLHKTTIVMTKPSVSTTRDRINVNVLKDGGETDGFVTVTTPA